MEDFHDFPGRDAGFVWIYGIEVAKHHMGFQWISS
jgi:hypothetical protein